jgi:general secretion pathway protein G
MAQSVHQIQRRAFTLIEILIVVVILGILAMLVVPQFNSITEQSKDTALRRQLQIARGQIQLYRSEFGLPEMTDWSELINNDFLVTAPTNPWIEGDANTTISAVPRPGAAWLWTDSGSSKQLFALMPDGSVYQDN